MSIEVAVNYLASMVFSIWASLPEDSAIRAELEPAVRALYETLKVIRSPGKEAAA